MKIIDYKILVDPSAMCRVEDIGKGLALLVEKAMLDGWTPQGGITMNQYNLCQAMVQYEADRADRPVFIQFNQSEDRNAQNYKLQDSGQSRD